MTEIKILNEEEVKELLTMDMVIDAVESAYIQKNSDKGNIWDLVFYEYKHNVFDLDIRSGNLDDYNSYGLKLISYNEENVEKGLPKVYATSLLFDSKTGKPLALLNASPITFFRTGAAAGIGAKYLARKDSKNLLVVGCGNVALYSIAATLMTIPSIENIYICNPNNYDSLINKLDDLISYVKKLLKDSNLELKANVYAIDNLEHATRMSDIIITATPSEKSLINKNWVKVGTHFSCMGACMSGKQEIDSEILRNAIVFADDEKQCKKSGELQNASDILINGEIGELILNKKLGRSNDTDITVFDSTGLFLQDLATATKVLEKADGKKLGLKIKI